MTFRPRGRFGPPYVESRGQNMGYGMPPVPGLGMMGPRGREDQGSFDRFPPPARDFHGRFSGNRWPRPEHEQVIGGSRGRGFEPRSFVPRHRFDKFRGIKEEPLGIPAGKESELTGKPTTEESVNFENSSGALCLSDLKRKHSNDITSPCIKQEEGTLRIKLDEYNSDLHFNSDESGLIGWTLHKDGFECLWGGGRATHGVKRGKVSDVLFKVTFVLPC